MLRSVLVPLLLVVPLAASAQSPAPAPPAAPAQPAAPVQPVPVQAPSTAPTAVPADPAKPDADPAKPGKPEKPDGLGFEGRVRAGAEIESRLRRVGDVESRQKELELALVEARLGVDYRAMGWLSLQLEADFANFSLKDAFVRAENKRFRGQFGQFKMPVSALAMESPWRLPVPERGLIQGILADHVQMLGRRQGLLGRFRAKGDLKPELSIGLFQGWLGNDNEPIKPDLMVDETFDSQNAVLRLGGRFAGVEVGVIAERISTLVAARVRHFWAAGLDATADYDLRCGGVRFWAEGFTGTTWKSSNNGASQPEIQFFTTRGVFAWRWGGVNDEDAYIEPYALGGLLDPDVETHSDLIYEAMLGLNVGAWKRFRVNLAGKLAGAQRGVPDQVFPGNVVVDAKTVELQVGAAF